MKIALFYNLPAGGAKRALYEHARHLRRRGHTVDGYVVSTASENYLPLRDVCDNVFVYELPAVPDRLSARLRHPRIEAMSRRLGPRAAHRHAVALDYARVRRMHGEMDALETLYAGMARDIENRGCDLAYVHQCIVTQSPPLLRYLAATPVPTVFFCQDTLRYVYEWSAEEISGYDALPEGRYMRKRLGMLLPRHTLGLFARREQQYVASTRAADVVLANSHYSREAILRTTGVNARVCYLGVDGDFWTPDPAVSRVNEVLSVGMLMAHKRHDFVLDAVATIPEARRPALRIIGYEMEFGDKTLGPLARRLLDAAERRNVRLALTKDVSDETLRAGYRRAGVVAFAPYLEPFGFVPLEAAACGAPVVGVAEGGVRETVADGVTGFLTGRDPAEFGGALLRVLTDADLAETLGRNGRAAVVERWTWERSVDDLERCFAEARRMRAAHGEGRP